MSSEAAATPPAPAKRTSLADSLAIAIALVRDKWMARLWLKRT